MTETNQHEPERDGAHDDAWRGPRWEVPEVLAAILTTGVVVALACSLAAALWQGIGSPSSTGYGDDPLVTWSDAILLVARIGVVCVGLLLIAALVLSRRIEVLMDSSVQGKQTPASRATALRRLLLVIDVLFVVTGIVAFVSIIATWILYAETTSDTAPFDFLWLVLAEAGRAAAVIAGCVGGHYVVRRLRADAALIDVTLEPEARA